MKEALELFNNYYNNFDSNEYWIQYKYDHTMRVVDYAETIANSLELSDDDIELAKKCALFHDIARFKQWQDYKTFVDIISFDHGDEGYNILKELGITDEIILTSTRVHNKYEVPSDLDDRTKMFCNITRDADKIDIMFTQALDVKDNYYEVTDEVIESFRNKKQVPNGNKDKSHELPNMLKCISFIFDVTYKKSFEIIKKGNLIDSKLNKVLEKCDSDRIKEIRDICHKYIDERISE